MAFDKLSQSFVDTVRYTEGCGKLSEMYSDGGGLSLKIFQNNSKSWVISYRINGKQFHKTLGQYPDITLDEARKIRLQYRRLLRDGIDPVTKENIGSIEKSIESVFADATLKMLKDLMVLKRSILSIEESVYESKASKSEEDWKKIVREIEGKASDTKEEIVEFIKKLKLEMA